MPHRRPPRLSGFPESPLLHHPFPTTRLPTPSAPMPLPDICPPGLHLQHRLRLERATERRRIARELHDELGQHLTAIQLTLAPLLQDAPPGTLRQLGVLVEETAASLRRLVGDQRPAWLDGHGPTAALRALGRDAARSLGIRVSVRVFGREAALTDAQALALYRIAQESLTNVARHARASAARMRLHWEPEQVTLILEDDGVGLPPDALARHGCIGLRSMGERVAEHGGSIEFSQRRRCGTFVRARLPLRPTGRVSEPGTP